MYSSFVKKAVLILILGIFTGSIPASASSALAAVLARTTFTSHRWLLELT
jgi:hypothetical protein